MLSLEIHKKIPIYHHQNTLYTSIAKVDKNYYFCDPCTCRIVKYSCDFKEIACYQVKRRYRSICYNHNMDCFFAITLDNCNKVYQLNHCFEEEDCIYIDVECRVLFSGISYLNNILYLSCEGYIVALSIDCKSKPEIWIQEKDSFTSVCKHPCYLLTSTCSYCNGTFKLYDNCKCPLLTTCLPCKYCIKDITYDSCHIYILVSTCDCYNFVLLCNINEHHCHPNPKQSCVDIMESIALIETSLSHILNAEGEKIQKILAISNDPDKILEVNRAVNKTITNVTHLEHVLYAKLESANCLCTKEQKK